MARFVPVDRDTEFLFPPSVQELLTGVGIRGNLGIAAQRPQNAAPYISRSQVVLTAGNRQRLIET